MEYVIHSVHGVLDRLQVSDVTDIELDLLCDLRHLLLELVAHIVLLLLVAGEDTDLTDIGLQKAVQNGVAERARAAGNQKGLVLE